MRGFLRERAAEGDDELLHRSLRERDEYLTRPAWASAEVRLRQQVA
jgi:hypothetical protein